MNLSWQVSGATASYQDSAWRVEFDAQRPQDGLTVESAAGIKRGLLALSLPGDCERENVTDIYPRGSDVVVAYDQRDERTVSPHVYFRVTESNANCLAVQLIISVQTSLLASEPTTVVSCGFDNAVVQQRIGQAVWSKDAAERANAFVAQFADQSDSIFLAIHPTDHPASTPVLDDSRFGFRLFADSIEKGVIRRARVVAGLATSSGDIDAAERAFERQATEAPPLTT